KIALVAIGEALDSGEIQVIDTKNNQVLFEATQNHFSISPEKNKICAISSNKIIMYNVETKQSQELKVENKNATAMWKDNNIIVFFQNSDKGPEYFYLDTRSNKTSPLIKIADLSNSGIFYIQGIIGNTAYVIDSEGKTRKIIIE
ncbi:MAG: hypothetical protein NZM26_00785, partial [Patescibacteria group bacterium]|nr:hypothetical protein [Patescibacteria group bacterium]